MLQRVRVCAHDLTLACPCRYDEGRNGPEFLYDIGRNAEVSLRTSGKSALSVGGCWCPWFRAMWMSGTQVALG
eukprot:1595992-Rhodomonas_salina.2